MSQHYNSVNTANRVTVSFVAVLPTDHVREQCATRAFLFAFTTKLNFWKEAFAFKKCTVGMFDF